MPTAKDFLQIWDMYMYEVKRWQWKYSDTTLRLPLHFHGRHHTFILHIKNMQGKKEKIQSSARIQGCLHDVYMVIWKQWFSRANYEFQVPWAETTFPRSSITIRHPQSEKENKNKPKINSQNMYALSKFYLAGMKIFYVSIKCGYIGIFTKESKKILEDVVCRKWLLV